MLGRERKGWSKVLMACLYLHQKTLGQEREMGYLVWTTVYHAVELYPIMFIVFMSSTCDAHVMQVCIMHVHFCFCGLWQLTHLIIQLCIMYCVRLRIAKYYIIHLTLYVTLVIHISLVTGWQIA